MLNNQTADAVTAGVDEDDDITNQSSDSGDSNYSIEDSKDSDNDDINNDSDSDHNDIPDPIPQENYTSDSVNGVTPSNTAPLKDDQGNTVHLHLNQRPCPKTI